ncbi:MAG: hypothetical protein L3J12_03050 [Spirochaetales bacterium]|nr:hypothetical protein [Spirochaetales bacterium]
MKIFLIILITLLSGCELFTDFRTVTVSLPARLPPWFIGTNQDVKIVYPGKFGEIESFTIPWTESIKIIIAKGNCIPVACYPSGFLKPAGGILPFDSTDNSQLQLIWENGFSADLLLGIMAKGVSLENLNINKLLKEINNQSTGDPWAIDKNILEDAILYSNLSVYKIRQAETLDISIPVLGLWVSDNPFYPDISSNTEGIIVVEGIYTGLHRFKNMKSKKYLDILIDTEGFEYITSQQY